MLRWLLVLGALAAGCKKPARETPPLPDLVGDMPQECEELRAATEALVACDRLSTSARELAKRSYLAMRLGPGSLHGRERALFAKECQMATEGLEAQLVTCGRAPPATAPPAVANKPTPSERPAPAAAGDLPRECQDYLTAIARIASCRDLTQAARDALRTSIVQTRAAWLQVPPAERPALATACVAATTTVKESYSVCTDVEVEKPLPAEVGDIPRSCLEYAAVIGEIVACDRLPQAARDAWKRSFDVMAEQWKSVTAETAAALEKTCRSTVDTLRREAASCL